MSKIAIVVRNPKAKQRNIEAELEDALFEYDELRGRMAALDALAAAAAHYSDAIPWVADHERRRRLRHLAELVAATASATKVAVDNAAAVAAKLLKHQHP